LSPELKTICYSCGDVSTSPNDPYYIGLIAKAIQDDQIPNCNLLIRTSPAESADRFEQLKNEFPWIQWNVPQWTLLSSDHQESWSQRIPSEQDLGDLKSILQFSDLNINMLSTMSLDFMLHGKPVINTVMGNGSNGLGGDQKFLNYAHIKLLLDSKATELACNQEQLMSAIHYALLKGPDRVAQSAFIDQQIGVSLEKTAMETAKALKSLVT
jgi:hypothetical protein